MRLAVSIAAWSRDPDATLPPEQTMLPSILQGLGFSVMHAALDELPASFEMALSGLEAVDTLLVHVSGVLDAGGSLELRGAEALALSAIADVLSEKCCGPALVLVETAYRGEEDAFRAVELVQDVTDALASDGAPYTTIVALHPESADAGRLAFTRLVLESVADVVKPNGLSLVDHAYARARERTSGLAASGFALMHGERPFYIECGRPVEAAPVAPPAAVTEPAFVAEVPARVARAEVPAPRESTRAFDLTDIASSRPGAFAHAIEISPDESGLQPALLDPADVARADLASAPAPSVDPVTRPFADVASAPALSVDPVTRPFPDVASAPALSVDPATSPFPDVPSAPALSADPATVPLGNVSPPMRAVSAARAASDSSVEIRADLDQLIAAATAAEDHRLAVELSRKRLPSIPSVEGRVDELFEIGRTLVAKLRDLPEAVVALEEARGLDPTRGEVLEALRRAYSRLERWTETLEVTLALIKQTADDRERAGLRVAAALLACQHLHDEEYGLELLALALGDDPRHADALDEMSRIRRARGEFFELERTLAALASRLVEEGHAARAWDVCQRLAAVRRDDLADTGGAVEALAIAKRLPLSELDSRAVLAEQLLALNDDDGAIAELEAIVAAAPLHVRGHARLFSVYHRTGNHDRAYLSALVLEELGDADATAREILEAYRSEWGLRARTVLDDRAWDRLRACGSDEVIEGVFRASVRAAIAAQLEDRANRLVLDPARRQPETSTASIVRCFAWAARALGTPCPELYVLDEVKGGIAAVSAPEPTTALGPGVTHGLSSRTLAFLAGRHLTYFRPEHQVLVHFPTAEAAAGLFFAAVELVAPGTFVPPNLALRAASAKHRLARHMRPDELAALSLAVGRMEAREAKVDLIGWIRSIELTAGRAGLLLSGDLQTALAQVRSEPRGLSGLSVEERRTDLLSFCASRALAELRASYADTSPSSIRPPTSESAVVRRDDASFRDFGEVKSAPRLLAQGRSPSGGPGAKMASLGRPQTSPVGYL